MDVKIQLHWPKSFGPESKHWMHIFFLCRFHFIVYHLLIHLKWNAKFYMFSHFTWHMTYQKQINSWWFSNEMFIWQNSIIKSLFIGSEKFQLKTLVNAELYIQMDECRWFEFDCPIIQLAIEWHVAYHFGFNENLLNSSRQTNTTQNVIHLSFPGEDFYDVRRATVRSVNTLLEWEIDDFPALYQSLYGLISIILRSLCSRYILCAPWAKDHQANLVQTCIYVL